MEFDIGDKIFVKISLIKGMIRFSKKRKFSLKYIRSFEIVERTGNLIYRLSLPAEMENFHDVFYISQLTK